LIFVSLLFCKLLLAQRLEQQQIVNNMQKLNNEIKAYAIK